MGPNYLERDDSTRKKPDYLGRDTGVDWRRHERDVERRSGGRRRAASGAAPGKPGDTRDETFLRECKSTRGAGMSISGKWINKISSEAIALNKIPLLELRFDGQTAPAPKDWVLIPAYEFTALVERSSQ